MDYQLEMSELERKKWCYSNFSYDYMSGYFNKHCMLCGLALSLLSIRAINLKLTVSTGKVEFYFPRTLNVS